MTRPEQTTAAETQGEQAGVAGYAGERQRAVQQTIKCVVWDLDNTIWEGVLLEDAEVFMREGVLDIIKELDARGILQSVASKNDHDEVMEKLRSLGVDEFFLYPQINWNSKVSSITRIGELINIGLNTVAFIDDQAYERAEVAYSLPEVLCIDVAELDKLLDMPCMKPRFITEDSKMRRRMYQSDIERARVEEEFVGPREEFLASLRMVLSIAPAREEDLQRAEELTVRTNQLNTTGYTYSYDELNAFRQSARHQLLIASLEDKFGSYGKIGLALLECRPEVWTVKLLLMSCRVMSRGVGSILLNHVMRLAGNAGASLRAEFVANERNRMMYVTYKFAGFKEISTDGEVRILEHDLKQLPSFPDFLEIRISD
jgi:FkbH-like protein